MRNPAQARRTSRGILVALSILALTISLLVSPASAAKPDKPPKSTPTPTPVPSEAVACTPTSAWTPGEVTVYWFDVEQGDSQLIIGPTGTTMLIDLGETAWNSSVNTNARRIEARIREICGTGTLPVALDYVMASHHHLDHIGYAGVPEDTSNYGNGLYQLLTPTSEGGFGFTVGTLIDHDGGTWTDKNHDQTCQVGTSSNPSDEIEWHNAGTVSQTARRWICWLYGPAGQADRANIEGHVATLTNSGAWSSPNLGAGVAATIVEANAKDVLQADGVTPVSGDHTQDAVPPSENDYNIGFLVEFGDWRYATAGDSDGEYNTSSFGYSYNDIEALLLTRFGDVDTLRANHHGSGHSSSQAYLDALRPETVIFSCGDNSYGHPSNRVLDALRTLHTDAGIGADAYLNNNPCDPFQDDGVTPTDYSGTFNHDGDIRLTTTGGGAGYEITYDAGTNIYTAFGDGGGATPTPTPTPSPSPSPGGDPADVVINEYLMAPQTTFTTEWVELYNPTSSTISLDGLYIDDLASGGGSPKLLPAGASIPAGGYYVFEVSSGFFNNTGSDSVRFLAIDGGVETVFDETGYSLSSTKYDQSFHRVGDGGTWCGTISTNVTQGATNPSTCP